MIAIRQAPRTMNAVDRLDRRLIPNERGCLIWHGAVTADGYGRASVDRKPRMAHRVAYELYYGPIPDGLTIDHLCYEKRCANPLHLEAVPTLENSRRSVPRLLGQDRVAYGLRCANGHLVEGDNLARSSEGRRSCRICRRAMTRELFKRKAVELAPQAQQLKGLRRQLGWTQKDVAKFLGLTGRETYASWEQGLATIPPHHLRSLCSLVGEVAA